jgi:hypothetical protein
VGQPAARGSRTVGPATRERSSGPILVAVRQHDRSPQRTRILGSSSDGLAARFHARSAATRADRRYRFHVGSERARGQVQGARTGRTASVRQRDRRSSRFHIRDGAAAARRLLISRQTGSAPGALNARSASGLRGQLVDRTPARRADISDRTDSRATPRLVRFPGRRLTYLFGRRLLAMQKVEGSSPFSRFREVPRLLPSSSY